MPRKKIQDHPELFDFLEVRKLWQTEGRAAVALLEAKKFGHPLSQVSRHQQRYPHQQIRDYLQEAQSLRWGILTNGAIWRLYCRDSKPSVKCRLDLDTRAD